jgi:hypothetical protein
MEFHRIDQLPRYRDIGIGAPWDAVPSISPAQISAAMLSAHRLRSEAAHRTFSFLGRLLGRLIRTAMRRAVPRLPTGAHGPDAIDFKCAHGRAC